MPNRLFQGVIQQMKEAINRVFGVIDEAGVVIASSDTSHIGNLRSDVSESLFYSNGPIAQNGFTYQPITTTGKTECYAFVEGEDKDAERTVHLLAVALSNLKNLYDEKYDRSSFIKNVILDNILPSDIFVKSKELHFNIEENRIVFLIRFAGHTDLLPYEMVQGLFPDKTKDYIISGGEQDIVLVKEIGDANCEIAEMEQLAASIVETLNSEFYARVSVGISTVVDTLKDLARAYKEARVAIEVGKVFDTEKTVISYENLGIGRLVYQLPTTLCDIFLQEVFKKGSIESLDHETLMTVQSFFENNLNVSETSRKLFVHRNTLVYRLEKIRKLTGLDLREFEHAITFKVALMVKRYLTSKPAKF